MTILNINNNVSEDYTYILDTKEIFYEKSSIPTGVFIYSNGSWSETGTSASNFDTRYNTVQQFILNHSQPRLLNNNEDFLSLITTPETVNKKVYVENAFTESTEDYYVVIAKVGAVYGVVEVEEQGSTETHSQVILNENFTENDYYALSTTNCTPITFRDLPVGEYQLFVKPSQQNFMAYNQTIVINNNFPARIIINTDTIVYEEIQQESSVYVGIKTANQTNFPNIPESQYFALMMDTNLIACIPIKSLSFENTKITTIQNYTLDDNDYLSAKQTYNLITKMLEEFKLYQTVENLQALGQIQNPQSSRIYITKRSSSDAGYNDDGLDITFDLYGYNPEYDPDGHPQNDNVPAGFFKIDNLTFSPNDFAPKNHASTATTYGLGTTSNYGHVKTINSLTQSSHANGTALSAYQGKVLNDTKQNVLVSGTNIKTINGYSVLGSGNLSIVPDLTDYYTKTEVDDLIGNIIDYIEE